MNGNCQNALGALAQEAALPALGSPVGALRALPGSGCSCAPLERSNPVFCALPCCSRSTASNSNRSTPACSPILRKRSRSPTPQDAPGDAMVEKGSEHSSDKSPSTPEQGVQRSCSSQSGRSGAKNSKVRASTGLWALPLSSAFCFSV